MNTASPFLPLLGLLVGYALVLFFNPIRISLRDGFRCIVRFKRIWLTFVLLSFSYFVFRFSTFTPLQRLTDLDPRQLGGITSWHWPRLADIWRETPLPALEGVAGIFDNATTTFPLSVVAAFLFLGNWRGLHAGLLKAMRQRFRWWTYPIYVVLVLSAVAAVFKPIVFWRLPTWRSVLPDAAIFQTSAMVDAAASIFEYLVGIYIQVYLITVALAWIKGLSFTEAALFQFAVRRFSYVLKWAGVIVLLSTLLLRLPLLLAYFVELPGVLDYQTPARYVMGTVILAFCSVQISLVLHNERLRDAFRAHFQLVRRNSLRLAWFLLIAALHFFLLSVLDAITREAIADRVGAQVLWKTLYLILRGFVTGWLLASWVCLFRQCETARINRETWIRY